MPQYKDQTPYTRVCESNFVFVAERWEEWHNGYCLSSGKINTVITANVIADSIYFNLSNTYGLRILNSFDFNTCYTYVNKERVLYRKGMDQYVKYYNTIVPVMCNLFYTGDNIDYIRFGMLATPELMFDFRIIEFYGYVREMTPSF